MKMMKFLYYNTNLSRKPDKNSKSCARHSSGNMDSTWDLFARIFNSFLKEKRKMEDSEKKLKKGYRFKNKQNSKGKYFFLFLVMID
jgi:hypothetical protein